MPERSRLYWLSVSNDRRECKFSKRPTRLGSRCLGFKQRSCRLTIVRPFEQLQNLSESFRIVDSLSSEIFAGASFDFYILHFSCY